MLSFHILVYPIKEGEKTSILLFALSTSSVWCVHMNLENFYGILCIMLPISFNYLYW